MVVAEGLPGLEDREWREGYRFEGGWGDVFSTFVIDSGRLQ